MANNIFWLQAAFAGLLGLCFGSFINVVVYRLPIILKQQWRQWAAEELAVELAVEPDEKPTKLTLSQPASSCPHCQHRIRWYENIPVLSYILLLGRCSQCKEPISLRYPFVEIFAALLALIGYAKFGWTLDGLVISAMLLALWAAALIDWDTQLLPDVITLPLLWAGLIYSSNPMQLFQPQVTLATALYGAVAGYLALWTVSQLFALVTKKQGMGHGDFKLLAALGAWRGYQALPEIILLSSLMACLYALFAFAAGKDATRLAFGPYLAAAGFISLCFGDWLRQGYLNWAGLT